jgi:four helix bundle protein
LDELTKDGIGSTTREVRAQLDRASLSALLNLAEGNGKRYPKVRAKFFDDARGSTTECAACLEALVAKRACDQERVRQGKELLVRVASMLTKLILRLDGGGSAHPKDDEQKSPRHPRPQIEYEYENEHEYDAE